MPKLKILVGSVLALGAVATAFHFKGDEIANKANELRYITNTEIVPALSDAADTLEDVEYVASVRSESRDSAVRVVTPSGQGSGTYAKVGKHFVVITAAHVVRDEPIIMVEGRNDEFVYAMPMLKGTNSDVAVLLIPEMNSRRPVDYTPIKRPKKIERLIGDEMVYTGFPSRHDLLTINGTVAGYERGHIIMHSYAWPGASGSGVFDKRGRMIGVVSAVDIGIWSYFAPPQLVEDIVWVAPLWDITEDEIDNFLGSRGMGGAQE